MAAELVMAAEIARVLGAAGGGHPPKAAETPSSETGDSRPAGEAPPSAGSGATSTASSAESGSSRAASPEGSGSTRAASPAESGTGHAPESVPDATPDAAKPAPGTTGATPDTPEARPSAATVGEPQRNGGAEAVAGEVAVVPGVARYHRRGCILIRFMGDTDLEILSREAAEEAGCVACRACQPDED